MGQVINSVLFLFVRICLSVRTLMVAFLDRFLPKSGTEVTTPSSKKEFVGGSTSHHPFLYLRQKTRHFGPKGPENPCKHKYANFCLKCLRIAKIPASCGKSGFRKTTVTSHFRPEVEVKQFCACALKNIQHNPVYLRPNR